MISKELQTVAEGIYLDAVKIAHDYTVKSIEDPLYSNMDSGEIYNITKERVIQKILKEQVPANNKERVYNYIMINNAVLSAKSKDIALASIQQKRCI